jgi:hypothetical protein
VSLLWRDQVRIALCPDRVIFVRLSQGFRPRVVAKGVITCESAAPGEQPWQPALETLKRVLPDCGQARADTVVILSNHFVRYALIPRCEQLSGEEEEMALVRHSFTKIYGAAAEAWEIRLSEDGGNGPRVASAVDQRLVESLREVLASSVMKLRSIQPYLMAAFNQWRGRLGREAGFVLVEPGRLCLALLRDRQWRAVRTARISLAAWPLELALVLDRERYLWASGDSSSEPAPAILVYAPEHVASDVKQEESSPIRVLQASADVCLADVAEAPFAMAMAG